MTSKHRTGFVRRPLALLLALGLSSCGGGSSDLAATFEVRLRGHGPDLRFRTRINSPQVLALARAQLTLPEDQRHLIISGRIARGDGGINPHWHWHLVDVSLVEMATEVCDGLPTDL